MCKYCDGWKNRYLDNLDKIKDKTKETWYNNDCSCYIMMFGEPTLYLDWPWIPDYSLTSIEISYCPFCGKKLI